METMTTKNVIADYVDRVTYLEEGNTKRVIAGEHRVYNTIAPNLYRPIETWSLEKHNNITLDALFIREVRSATASFIAPNSTTTGSLTIPEHSTADVNIKFEYNDNNVPVNNEVLILIICRLEDDWITETCIYEVTTYNLVDPTYDGYSCIGYNANNECRIFSKTIGLPSGEYRIRVTSANYEKGNNNPCWSGTATITATVKNQTIAASNFLKREVLYGYDEKGNIRTAVSANNTTVPTHYLWGYNSQYPIAKIENALYSEVTGKIAQSILTNIANKAVPETADWTIINNLRTQLPSAMITTYTYKPLVGIETVTDPRGIKMTYIYDSLNRLKEIRDHNGKTLETYEYNYKQ